VLTAIKEKEHGLKPDEDGNSENVKKVFNRYCNTLSSCSRGGSYSYSPSIRGLVSSCSRE
jgi:hypothetical protein